MKRSAIRGLSWIPLLFIQATCWVIHSYRLPATRERRRGGSNNGFRPAPE